MKNTFVKSLLSLALAAGLGTSLLAVPITGEIHLSGKGAVTLINDFGTAGTPSPTNADAIDFPAPTGAGTALGNAFVTATSGSFLGLDGLGATQSDFRFAGAGGGFSLPPISPLWAIGATGWSFDLNSITLVDQGTPGFLNLAGGGVFHGPAGFNDTLGTWSFTVTTTGSLFTWTSSNSVPEGGSTAVLLGFTLLGLGVLVRRNKRQ